MDLVGSLLVLSVSGLVMGGFGWFSVVIGGYYWLRVFFVDDGWLRGGFGWL